MAQRETEGKADDVETVSIDTARDVLGDLVIRAAMKGERTIITRHGKPSAALVGIPDLDKLRSTDAA